MSQKETHVNATEPRVHINQLRLPAEPSSIQSTSQGGHPPLPTITPELMQEMWAHEPIGLRRVAPPSERWAWQAAYLNNALRDPNRPRACCDVTPSGNIIDENIAHPTNEKEEAMLQQDSMLLNQFCWRLAEAMGDVGPDDESKEVVPPELLARVIARLREGPVTREQAETFLAKYHSVVWDGGAAIERDGPLYSPGYDEVGAELAEEFLNRFSNPPKDGLQDATLRQATAQDGVTEAMEARFKANERNERRRSIAEVDYWRDQWRLLARDAIAALSAQQQGAPDEVTATLKADELDWRRRQMQAVWNHFKPNASNDMEWADEIIIAAQQQGEGEAVAYMTKRGAVYVGKHYDPSKGDIPLYTAPPAQPAEPPHGSDGDESYETSVNPTVRAAYADGYDVGYAHGKAAQPAERVPEGWREDVALAAQMLTWGADEGLTESQERDVRVHQAKLFAMLAASPAAPAERVPDGWVPISSAPCDGTMHVRGLAVHGTDGTPLYWDACAGHIDQEDGRFVDQGGDDFGWEAQDFTHWHPLAPSPARGDGGERRTNYVSGSVDDAGTFHPTTQDTRP